MPVTPFPYSADDLLSSAWQRGWSHGHGIACHNVPSLGQVLWTGSLGRVKVTAENIREVHEDTCFEAADEARDFSPFEQNAHEFNSSEFGDELWEAFEAGQQTAIWADLAEYDSVDYGIEEEEQQS